MASPLSVPSIGSPAGPTFGTHKASIENALGLSLPVPTAPGAVRLVRLLAEDLEAMDLPDPAETRFHPTLWLAWAILDRPVGGGLASCVDSLSSLPDDDLLQGAVDFLTWIASPIEGDHPLLSQSRAYGFRTRPDPLRGPTAQHYARSYLEWRLAIARPSSWTTEQLLSMADLSQAPATRQRFELTLEALVACLDSLERCAVVDIADPLRSGGWHARERAALLVRVWGVLRAGEVIELRTDLELTDYGLRLRLREPKTGGSRWVRLPLRGDRFCPVRAIEEWLDASYRSGYDHKGRLLPVVLRRRQNGSVLSEGRASERNNIRAVFEAAGLSGELADDETVLGLHSFRSVLPTMAADAGHDLPFLQALGAWARGSTPANSYLARRDGMDEARAMAELGDVA